MDASAALERLTEISSQVRTAVVFERGGAILGTTLADDERADEIASEARELLRGAESRRGATDAPFAQLEVALQTGSVFVVGDEERLIVATTTPDPTVGLVFYDLKSCLRDLEEPAKPKRAAAKPKPRAAAPKADAAEPKPKPRTRKSDAKP